MENVVKKRRKIGIRFLILLFFMWAVTVTLFPAGSPLIPGAAWAAPNGTAKGGDEGKTPEKEEEKPKGPLDEYDRGVPSSSLTGFMGAAEKGDYDRAENYLDLRKLPPGMDPNQGPDLARKLKVVLDRSLWVDSLQVSDDPRGESEDGLPSYRDSIGRLQTPDKTFNILLQRVPRKEDGVSIWKFSNRTVAEIPELYEHFGYKPFEEKLSEIFPDFLFLGWYMWQWVLFLLFTLSAFIAVLLVTWFIGFLLRRRGTEMYRVVARFFTGPIRIVAWLLLTKGAAHLIGPSVTVREMLQTSLFLTFAGGWAALRLVDIVVEWLTERFRQSGQDEAIVLMRPVRSASKIMVFMFAFLLILDNMGFKVNTLLAGLGVGGLAVALAAQESLKNLLGSIMILGDRPYHVGHRIVIKGHDGVVEDIGLRSTKMRLLSGHQTTVPNDEMARIEIENISRRPHIRRLTNIYIPYDTPADKVEKAVRIIEEILKDHEGMDPKFPPRVYFNEFNRDCLNIQMIYWFHPPEYWDFQAFNQKVNLQIMQAFEKEEIRFSIPARMSYLAQEEGESLTLHMEKDS